MTLSSELISEFVKITNDSEPADTNQNSILYGVVKMIGGDIHVQLDGSDIFTPAVSVVEVADGEKVVVSIKDHSAIITGNVDSPAVRTETANNILEQIIDVTDIIGDKSTLDDPDYAEQRIYEIIKNILNRTMTVEQTNEDITYKFDLLEEKTETFKNEVTKNQEVLSKYIRFIDGDIVLGADTPTFSTEKTYDVGQYVIYESVTYKCISAVTSPGEWDSSKWEETSAVPHFKVQISNESINFILEKEDGSEQQLTHIDYDDLVIEEARVKKNLYFGNYRWFVRSNGNMALKREVISSGDSNN